MTKSPATLAPHARRGRLRAAQRLARAKARGDPWLAGRIGSRLPRERHFLCARHTALAAATSSRCPCARRSCVRATICRRSCECLRRMHDATGRCHLRLRNSGGDRARSIDPRRDDPALATCATPRPARGFVRDDQPTRVDATRFGECRHAAGARGSSGGCCRSLVGRRGDFYRILGSAVAEIDGYTGTMPPYERHIVLGSPQSRSSSLATIAHVMWRSCLRRRRKRPRQGGSDRRKRRSPDLRSYAAVFCCNPAGNADEQTPVVILKYRPRAWIASSLSACSKRRDLGIATGRIVRLRTRACAYSQSISGLIVADRSYPVAYRGSETPTSRTASLR